MKDDDRSGEFSDDFSDNRFGEPDPTSTGESDWDRINRLANEGGFEALFERNGSFKGPIDLGTFAPLVQRAFEVASQKDPEGFSQRAFRLMTGFAMYLCWRGHCTVATMIGRCERSGEFWMTDHWQQPGPPREVLDNVMEMQGHVANLLQAQAITARTWGLVQKNAKATSKKAARPRRRPRSATKRGSKCSARNRPNTKSRFATQFSASLNGKAKPVAA